MASKGKWSLRQADWEWVYWNHSLSREKRLSPNLPTAEQVSRASARARLVTARYKHGRKRLGLSTAPELYRRSTNRPAPAGQ